MDASVRFVSVPSTTLSDGSSELGVSVVDLVNPFLECAIESSFSFVEFGDDVMESLLTPSFDTPGAVTEGGVADVFFPLLWREVVGRTKPFRVVTCSLTELVTVVGGKVVNT